MKTNEKTSKRNKVHKSVHGGALCGCDHGGNFGKVVPISRENRDVTCKNCKRMLRKKP